MIHKYPKCHRGLEKICEPIDCIAVPSEDATDEQRQTLEFVPDSFVCCGLLSAEYTEELPQDCYRFCFKNSCTDEMTDNDEQDLTHMMKVVTTALAVTATRRVNSGTIDVPTLQGDKVE